MRLLLRCVHALSLFLLHYHTNFPSSAHHPRSSCIVRILTCHYVIEGELRACSFRINYLSRMSLLKVYLSYPYPSLPAQRSISLLHAFMCYMITDMRLTVCVCSAKNVHSARPLFMESRCMNVGCMTVRIVKMGRLVRALVVSEEVVMGTFFSGDSS